MRLDTRFSRLLHVLVHMHLKGGSTTSETIAQMLHTNPALVRRTMAPLREAGYVESERGPGGGWSLSCNLTDLSAKDIYLTLAANTLFNLGLSNDHPDCPVEFIINHELDRAMQNAHEEFLQSLQQLKLATLAENIKSKCL